MSGEVSGEGKEASCLRPLVVCGPSGVGKGTLVGRLLKNYPKTFGFCVSHTTRSARPGETNGVDYWYHKKEDMQRDIDDGKFVEYAQVHDNLYGTSLAATERVAKEGKVCILDIDVQGVRSVKGRGKDFINPYYLFIAPPSLQALEERLRGRGTEAEEAVKVRLGNAREEVEYGQTPGNFDQVIVNDDIDKAHEDLMRALKRWYPQLQQEQLWAGQLPSALLLCLSFYFRASTECSLST
ncbi:unnamed protein product [Chrysoparadoxa australica]